MAITVAIVGRPNVGKSALFNRLVGKRLAMVEATPGVTRDRREGEARLADLEFNVIDTPGLAVAAKASLEARQRDQALQAIQDSELALFVIDGRAGVTPLDEHFAQWLRKSTVPVVVVVNKCEGEAASAGILEAFGLGLDEPVAVSALHGDGMAELYQALAPHVKLEGLDGEEDAGVEAEGDEGQEKQPVGFAIAGRPNVGKSTLINRLVGEQRMVTGPEPGMTREAIAVSWSHRGRPLRLIDTAGLRRRTRVTEKLEKLSTTETLRAIRLAQCVVLVMDATQILERQDLTIAKLVVDEGRALVLALNKWDLVEDRDGAMALLRDRLSTSLPQVRGVPYFCISALTGQNLDKLMDGVFQAYEVWNRRVTTSQLNLWLKSMVEQHPPPLVAGRQLRLRYMTQVKARPPTFVLFAARPTALPANYVRYLTNGLREAFDLPGVPLRLHLRKGANPYAPKK